MCQKSLLSQPTLSHHFQRLVEAGVVAELKIGVAKRYKLNRSLLECSGINVNKL
ncbi:winged helix-turn-helix transcriptional regulator [Candidatus Saccharibacteria bacterium]|nr:winged helix-turn-helix transcriptional regulator [Candidatus Saccharibacteria bacterium]